MPSRVDLPQPEGPMIETNSPSLTSRETSASARTGCEFSAEPNVLLTPLTSNIVFIAWSWIARPPRGVQDNFLILKAVDQPTVTPYDPLARGRPGALNTPSAGRRSLRSN